MRAVMVIPGNTNERTAHTVLHKVTKFAMIVETGEGEMRYKQLEIIKDSEKSKIYLALDRESNKTVVVKRLSSKSEFYQRLQHLSHPYLPQIYDVQVAENSTIVYEEYIPGGTLDHISASEGQIIRWMMELCTVLEFLHSHGILHRDIKPSNILLGDDGHIRLIDFDAARVGKPEADSDTRLLGTKGYAPPEQYGFAQTDARADVYALGVTLRLLLGDKAMKRPYRHVIRKCTEFAPEKRYQSAKAVAVAIKTRHLHGIGNACAVLVLAAAVAWWGYSTLVPERPPIQFQQEVWGDPLSAVNEGSDLQSIAAEPEDAAETHPLSNHLGKWYATALDSPTGFAPSEFIPDDMYEDVEYLVFGGVEIEFLEINAGIYAQVIYSDHDYGELSARKSNDDLLPVEQIGKDMYQIVFDRIDTDADEWQINGEVKLILSLNARGELFIEVEETITGEDRTTICSKMPMTSAEHWLNGQYRYYDTEASYLYFITFEEPISVFSCEKVLNDIPFYGARWIGGNEIYEFHSGTVFIHSMYINTYQDWSVKVVFSLPGYPEEQHTAFWSDFSGRMTIDDVVLTQIW